MVDVSPADELNSQWCVTQDVERRNYEIVNGQDQLVQ